MESCIALMEHALSIGSRGSARMKGPRGMLFWQRLILGD